MRLLLQILFLFLTWFTNLAYATPVFVKVVLPSYERTFSKTENVKEESIVKIGFHNFARSGIEENLFSQNRTSGVSYALVGASRAGECKVVQGAGNLSSKLISRGLSSSVADDIALRAMYIDDVIGANKMQSMIDELVSSPKFKNPEDLLENLNSAFRKPVVSGNVNTSSANDLLNELNEGKYWMNQGNEVYISKKWTTNANEVDVTITTKNALVECKNITGVNFKSVEDNLRLVVEKYTVESKLSSAIKNQYPNHFGKLNINSSSSPFYNSNKADFISKIKNGDIANGQMSIIGNGSNQFTLSNLKVIKELHIENAQGRFVIKNTDW